MKLRVSLLILNRNACLLKHRFLLLTDLYLLN